MDVPRPLTSRELDVLRGISLGETRRQTARRLGVAEDTVATHVRHLLRKLHAHNRAHAVAIAIRSRII